MMHSSSKILTAKTEVKDLYSNHNISSYPQIKDIGHTVKKYDKRSQESLKKIDEGGNINI